MFHGSFPPLRDVVRFECIHNSFYRVDFKRFVPFKAVREEVKKVKKSVVDDFFIAAGDPQHFLAIFTADLKERVLRRRERITVESPVGNGLRDLAEGRVGWVEEGEVGTYQKNSMKNLRLLKFLR